jgi:hypothetical protein
VQGTDPQHRFACIRTAVRVLAVATTSAQPGEGAFDTPTFGEQHNACATRRVSHHCQAPVALRCRCDPVVACMIMVLVIGLYHCQTRGGLRTPVLQNLWSGDRVIDSGTAHQAHQQPPQSIDADVTLSPGDLLAAVLPPFPSTLGRFHRLTLDTGGAGRGLVRGGLLLLDVLAPRVHHVLPRAIVSPLGNTLGDRAFGKHVVRQHIPLTAGSVAGQDGVVRTSRISNSRGRPPGFAGGISGWRIAHGSSVRSD